MGKIFFKYLLIIFLCIKITSVFSQTIFEKYTSKEALREDVETLVKEFDIFIKEKGATPPYIPSVEIKTTNSLIYWDSYNKNIVLPFWDELYTEQKQMFVDWRGENAEEFFVAMFNWFFIPHELGHFITQLDSNYILTPYKSEWAANEFAVAFLNSEEENQDKIEYIEKSLKEVLTILPAVELNGMTEEEYFNANYDGLGVDPNVYAYFQFNMILNILENKDKIDIQNYLINLD